MQLQIVSTSGRVYRQHFVDGINTIGVQWDEEFMIRFRNSLPAKVQMRLAVDGTDVQTGEPPSLDPSGTMWVIDAYGTMELKAWPETSKGGVRFRFSTAGESVALHTHGDMGAQGYISAAVFIEGYQPPVVNWREQSRRANAGMESFGQAKGLETMRGGGSAVGAGQYVQQEIGRGQGLREPRFSEIVQVRHMWWDQLEARLREAGINPGHPTGFESRERPMANLGSTPRPGQPGLGKRPEPYRYSRFE
ncbi:MAG: hypothetical protein Q8P72_01930 [Candidatus Roizmanbacteria bacterium]|nr:hypothetical protein [Candidatus Roizmanbacteria bacterium]